MLGKFFSVAFFLGALRVKCVGMVNNVNPDHTNHVNPDQTNHVNPDQTNHVNPDQTNHVNPDQIM